jgi:DNA uptake protein ComE-like DNA-binding protein
VNELLKLLAILKNVREGYNQLRDRAAEHVPALERRHRGSAVSSVASFAAGMGLGVGLGILLAPERGERTRSRIKEAGRRFTGGPASAVRESAEHSSTENQSAPRTLDIVRSATQPSVQLRPTEEPSTKGRQDPLSFINQSSREELIQVDGIGPVVAAAILKGRPYQSIEAVLLDKELPPSTVELVQAECLRRKTA